MVQKVVKALKDFFVILGLVAAFKISVLAIQFGFTTAGLGAFFIVETLFYTLAIYLCFSICIRLLKSSQALLIASLLLTLAIPLLSAIGAAKSNVTFRLGGMLLIENGALTFYGFLYHVFTPFLFLAFFAGFRLLRN